MAKRTADEAETTTSEPRESAPRLNVQLTPDGRVAWDRIRPSTKAQLATAFSDPAAPEQLGIAATATGAAQVDAFDAGMTGLVYDTLSNFMIGLARRSGYTDDQAGVLRFTDDEKTQLGPPTAAVLNKYAGALGKYQEELTLAVAVTLVISGKVSLLRKAASVTRLVPRDTAIAPGEPGERPPTFAEEFSPQPGA
jgi:hypothetical protein